jgi:hypothetical protein
MHNKHHFHWLHPKVSPGTTNTSGDGLFATGKIKAGERILVFGGYVLTVEEESQLPGKLGDNGVQIAKDLVICSIRPQEWGGGELFEPQLRAQCRLQGADCDLGHA